MYKALILDMDGTLLNSEKMVLDSLEILLADYQITLTPEQKRMSIGCTSDTLMAELGLPRAEEMSMRWRELMSGMLDKVGLFEGTEAVLNAPIRRGIVTSEVRGELDINLQRLGIADKIEFSVCADELPYQKPHPQPLLHCIASMGLAPEEVLFVGDTDYDIRCAAAAGVDFGLAYWGAKSTEGFGAARYIFQKPEEMLRYIRLYQRETV